MFWHFRPYAIENTNPFALTYMSRLFTHTSSPRGGDIPGNSWWGCAARFSKSWPYFRPKNIIFHTRFQTCPLKSIPQVSGIWIKSQQILFGWTFCKVHSFFYVNVLHVTIRSRKVMQITYLHDQTVDVSSGRAVWNIDMYQSCCNTRLCCKYVTSSNAVTYLHILRYCVDDYVHVLLISLKWKQPFLLQNVTFVAVRIYDGYDSLLCGSLPRRRLRGRLTLCVLRFHFLELWYFASVQF